MKTEDTSHNTTMTHNPFHNENPPSYMALAAAATTIFTLALVICHMF